MNISTTRLQRTLLTTLGAAGLTVLAGCSVGGGAITLTEGGATHQLGHDASSLTDGVQAHGLEWAPDSDAAPSAVGGATSGELIDGTPAGATSMKPMSSSRAVGGAPHPDLTD